jgi:ketosteroid isomerase-like protein
MKKLVTLLPLILVAVGCTQGGAPAADPSEITARSAEWDAALNAKDIDGIVALYTDDARMMAPNMPAGTGSDGVRAAFTGMIEAGLSVKLTSVDAVVSGDVGYNVGTYVLSAGDEQADIGKFLEVWERGADGVWRISNDIYNSDLPAAAPEPSMPMEMTHVMITHEVEDGEHWLAAWQGEDSRENLFKANGAMHVHTLQNADNPNLTGLIVAVSDMDAFTAMLESEEGQAAAAEDGVVWETVTMLTDAK